MEKESRGDAPCIQIADIMQLCCLGGLTGVAEIQDPAFTGWIYLTEGQIVHAAADGEEGEAAFYRIVNSGGDLEFREGSHDMKPTIDKGWEYLLLEAARIRDTKADVEETEKKPVPTLLKLKMERILTQPPVQREPPPGMRTNITGSIKIHGAFEECMIDRLGMDECWLRSLALLEKGDRFTVEFDAGVTRGRVRLQAEVVSTTEDDLSVHVRFPSVDARTARILESFLRKR